MVRTDLGPGQGRQVGVKNSMQTTHDAKHGTRGCLEAHCSFPRNCSYLRFPHI